MEFYHVTVDFIQLDVKDPLIQLANTINWTVFDDAFEQPTQIT